MPNVGGKDVEKTGEGYVQWEDGNDDWCMNWALAIDKGGKRIFHVTKKTNQRGSKKIHFFYYTQQEKGGTRIVSCVAPSEFRSSRSEETKKFDDLPNNVKTYITTNYDALFAL